MYYFWQVFRMYFFGEEKKYAKYMGLTILIVSQIPVYIGYQYINWNLRFYDALANKDFSAFKKEIIVFIVLAISFVIFYSYCRYYGQHYFLKWRKWMTKNALDSWYMHNNKNLVESPDQRIQEDLMQFSVMVEKLTLEGLNAIFIIFAFSPTLFFLSKNLTFFGYNVPGILWFAVVFYTLFGVLFSIKIAKPLVHLEYEHQKLEAQFRYKLVHARDGDKVGVNVLHELFAPIIENYKSIFHKQLYFHYWQKSYDQIAFLLPFVLAVPGYFSGALTLGMLMQIRSVFSRIRKAMTYLLDHYTDIAEIQAISKRIYEFNKSVGFSVEYLKEKELRECQN